MVLISFGSIDEEVKNFEAGSSMNGLRSTYTDHVGVGVEAAES